MMKKCVALLMALFMALQILPAVAESSADALDYEELMTWVQGFKDRALAAGEPLNDPNDEAYHTEDGYTFVYDFATLYMDRPEMTVDSVVQALVVTSSEEEGPRGTRVDYLSSEILSAFYDENEQLLGDSSFAALYLSDTMPAGALWGWVQRDGQRLKTIQYAVHEQLSSGGDGYTDCGLLYTLSDNLVAAIRAYGLNTTISADEVLNNLDAVQEVCEETSYAQVPTSVDGTTLGKFDRDDLLFSGLDFLSTTPEEAMQLLGQPLEGWRTTTAPTCVPWTSRNAHCCILMTAKSRTPAWKCSPLMRMAWRGRAVCAWATPCPASSAAFIMAMASLTARAAKSSTVMGRPLPMVWRNTARTPTRDCGMPCRWRMGARWCCPSALSKCM